jgi:1,2-phenylacetyl-CoA epoxidase catalytic subunit
MNDVTRDLELHAAAHATAADVYARAYRATKDADEKYACCRLGAEDMTSFLANAKALAELGVDVSDVVTRPAAKRGFAHGEALDDCATWIECAVVAWLFEGATLARLRDRAERGDAPVASMARDAIGAKQSHVERGLRLVREACAKSRDEVQRAVARIAPAAFALVDGEARARFVAATQGELAGLGLAPAE